MPDLNVVQIGRIIIRVKTRCRRQADDVDREAAPAFLARDLRNLEPQACIRQ